MSRSRRFPRICLVALRKESVDRNTTDEVLTNEEQVALRKESVDRNPIRWQFWPGLLAVALRKESVDRNTTIITICIAWKRSLSARRAWIEIVCMKEVLPWALRRSPQGERG